MKIKASLGAGGLAFACALFVAGPGQAQGQGAKGAIERLEGCSAVERRSGCVKILKQRSAGGDRLEIKAQIRGGRIIWYEYDRKSGAVRRLN